MLSQLIYKNVAPINNVFELTMLVITLTLPSRFLFRDWKSINKRKVHCNSSSDKLHMLLIYWCAIVHIVKCALPFYASLYKRIEWYMSWCCCLRSGRDNITNKKSLYLYTFIYDMCNNLLLLCAISFICLLYIELRDISCVQHDICSCEDDNSSIHDNH